MNWLKKLLGKRDGGVLPDPKWPRPVVDTSIVLRSGQYFDLCNPEGAVFLLSDIAHALSHLCRFTGHVDRFYSVAEHSVRTSYLVPPEFALQALLHDAVEAYVGDMSSPLKSMVPEYKAIEKRIEAALFESFGLPLPGPEVRAADLQMLLWERRMFLREITTPWPCLVGVTMPTFPPDSALDRMGAFPGWLPGTACEAFIRRYAQLLRGSP